MIRLVTVIGHGIELLPHFIQHYQKYVDEIQIVAYKTKEYSHIVDNIRDIVDNYQDVAVVKVVEKNIFNWEEVTKLYNEITYKKPNDWWVVTDIDEFHLYPGDDLKKMVDESDENGWDIIRGGFIDRVGLNGLFPQIQKSPSIWEQFPNAGFFRYPMSGACPNKICVKKGGIELTSGQHYVKIDGHTTWRWQGWNHPLINPKHTVQVHHFKWDESSIKRLKMIADLNQDYAFSDEYARMYYTLSKYDFRVDIGNNNYMFEKNQTEPIYNRYKQWNYLINKIMSI
jgi:hypothetical protein